MLNILNLNNILHILCISFARDRVRASIHSLTVMYGAAIAGSRKKVKENESSLTSVVSKAANT